jgi:hypothetical protein
VSVLRPTSALVALLLGGASAWGLTACGQDTSKLIPSGDADAILAALDDAQASLAAGECQAAEDAARRAQRAADGLSRQVDRRLRDRLDDGIAALERELPRDCEAPTTTATETVEPTLTETTPPAPTTETTPAPTTTETTPAPTTTTPAPTATEPAPDTGTGDTTGGVEVIP